MALHIQKVGIEIMRQQIAEGKAKASTHASFLPYQAEILVEFYAQVADLRERPGFSNMLFAIHESIVQLSEEAKHREPAAHLVDAFKRLFALVFNAPWTEDALMRALEKTRLLKGLFWHEPVVISLGEPVVCHGLQKVDQLELRDGDRVLLRKQKTFEECGAFIVREGAWERAADKLEEGCAWFAESDDPYILGTHPESYKQFRTLVYRPGRAWVCMGKDNDPWFQSSESRQP